MLGERRKAGPLIHREDQVMSEALYPRVPSSAGLSSLGTYLQSKCDLVPSMRLRRLLMKIRWR